MSQIGILILSDIHYCEDAAKCRLADKDGDYLARFLTKIQNIKDEKDITLKYMLIAGDIVEAGKQVEYDSVTSILEKICEEAGINKKHILMVPGNHDVFRSALESHCDNEHINENEAYTLTDVKFKNYIAFYKNFTKNPNFIMDKSILSQLDLDECRISVLGINSNVKESHRKEDHYGYIDIDKLREEVKELPNNRRYIVLTHHSWSNDREKELPTIRNSGTAKGILTNKHIVAFLYGHHHAFEGKGVHTEDGEFYYYEIGSFSKILGTDGSTSAYNNMFAVAVIDADKPALSFYRYISIQDDWKQLGDGKPYDIDFSHILNSNKKMKPSEDFMEEVGTGDSEEESRSDGNLVNISANSEKYAEIIAKKKLYREGHFHWKNGKKTRAWIDVAAFLGDSLIISNIRKDLKTFYSNLKSRRMTPDVVIGYGMEGNIIGSSLTPFFLREGIRYLYCPSVHRGEMFTDEEKALWNRTVSVKTAIFIFDFMPSDEYIEEIVEADETWRNLRELYIFAVFWTEPHKIYLNNICIDTSLEIESKREHTISLERYSVCCFPIEQCNEDPDKCLVCQKHLSEVFTL